MMALCHHPTREELVVADLLEGEKRIVVQVSMPHDSDGQIRELSVIPDERCFIFCAWYPQFVCTVMLVLSGISPPCCQGQCTREQNPAVLRFEL